MADKKTQGNAGGTRSIFDYITDPAAHVHDKRCFEADPPFLVTNVNGAPPHNVDVSTELRGPSKNLCKCAECRFDPSAAKKIDSDPHNLPDCKRNG